MPTKRVLIIDDEEDIREVVRVSLAVVGGWEVLLAASADAGLARAAVDQPDAILLDVMMPGIDGHTAVRLLRDNPATRRIPVILLTAKVQVTDRHAFAALAVTAVIAKPFDPMTLPVTIAAALGWSR